MTYCYIIICPAQTAHSIDEHELNEIERLLKQLFKNYNKAHSRKFEIVSSNSNIVLIKTENLDTSIITEELYNKEDYVYFQKFISMLKNDLLNTRKITNYSTKLGITTRKLSAICQFYKSKNPKEIISEYLVTESKRLLTKTSYSIKQIALQLGFSDQYQFSKYFKKHEKVPPGFYRKRSN